jgi:hypothetical protein
MIKVSFKGKEELTKILEKMPRRTTLALFSALNQSLLLIQGKAQEGVPVRSSALKTTIKTKVEQEGESLIGTVGSDLPYASVVEFGQRTGWRPNVKNIREFARRRFGDPRKAWFIFKKYQEGRYKGTPYLRPALAETQSRIQMIFNEKINQAIQEAGGGA